jgi:hypothetical protein
VGSELILLDQPVQNLDNTYFFVVLGFEELLVELLQVLAVDEANVEGVEELL